MRTAFAIALGLVSAAALAQATQPGSQPGVPSSASATAGIPPIPMMTPDAGNAQASPQQASDAGPATRQARTGDQTQPAQRIYSFDPLPIGSYSFEAPPSTTSQSSPSSNPR